MRVRAFNTHLAERRQAPVRAAQTRVLAEAVARYDRTIVLGDFNAMPAASELTVMWALRGFAPLEQRVHLTPWSDHDLVQVDLSHASGHTGKEGGSQN